jgi:hypothetical protein
LKRTPSTATSSLGVRCECSLGFCATALSFLSLVVIHPEENTHIGGGTAALLLQCGELLRLMGLLKKSYQFAKKFNEDKDLRMQLWRQGSIMSSCRTQFVIMRLK